MRINLARSPKNTPWGILVVMCRPVQCPTCRKTTWAGCGQHIDAVKAQVPPGQWCTCPRTTNQPQPKGLLAALLRRR